MKKFVAWFFLVISIVAVVFWAFKVWMASSEDEEKEVTQETEPEKKESQVDPAAKARKAKQDKAERERLFREQMHAQATDAIIEDDETQKAA